LITAIEGIDQSGKRTQAELLVDKLKLSNFSAVKVSFPAYDTPVGQLIRKVLMNEITVPLEVRHILLSANRWELKPKIDELIKQGLTIVFDRYYQSNLAYGLAGRLQLEWLKNLDKGLPSCDLTIVIDIPPNTSFNRKRQNRDLHEKDLEYLELVRRNFIKLAKKYRWSIVNGDRPIYQVHQSIWEIVSEKLKHTTF
jgi:dTMP kinase